MKIYKFLNKENIFKNTLNLYFINNFIIYHIFQYRLLDKSNFS